MRENWMPGNLESLHHNNRMGYMKYTVIKSLQLILMAFLVFFCCANVHASQQDKLRLQLEASQNGRLMIGQSDIAMLELVKNFYQYSDYQPAWKNQSMIDVLLKEIDESYYLGLSPDDYHLADIKTRLKSGNKTDEQRAQLDIILTDSLLRLAYHLSFGKVVPGTLDPDWNLRREFMSADPVAKLHYTLRSEQNLKKLLGKANNPGPIYQGLVKALAQYRQIQQSGGWKSIANGSLIKPGMNDPRIPLIKARLQATGDLNKSTIDLNDHKYNAQIEAGVKKFQQRHTLEADGIIGSGTLEQMNITVAARINQIRANLERVRWVRHNLGDEFVLVNIAGYKIYYVRDDKLIWKSKVQVGKDYRQTPVFRDDIKYLVFNPTWTVPPTILSKDVLPKIKKDRSYLQKKNMNVVDYKGNVINPDTINWSSMTAKNFPYMIRQEPGSANSLGRVKMMFPNKHLVYLHDTPSKRQFERAERAFSSGCVRVENPFELVELLLKDNSKWNQTSFKEILDSGKLKNVNLPQTVPVLLLYFTSRMSEDGQIVFYKDIYKRDEKVITGLKEPFHLVMPEQKNHRCEGSELACGALN